MQMMAQVTIAGYVNAYLNCNMETMKKLNKFPLRIFFKPSIHMFSNKTCHNTDRIRKQVIYSFFYEHYANKLLHHKACMRSFWSRVLFLGQVLIYVTFPGDAVNRKRSETSPSRM